MLLSTVVYYDGLYYFFGPSYGPCQQPPDPSGCSVWHPGGCGFQLNHNVSLYIYHRIYLNGQIEDQFFK